MKPAFLALTCTAIVALAPATAGAYVISTDPGTPPGMAPTGPIGFHLTGTTTPFFNFGGNTVSFDSFQLRSLAPITRAPQGGVNELSSYSANSDAVGDVFIPGTGSFNDVASQAIGDGAIVTLGKIGNTTGTFDTEMLSMNLSGSSFLGPYMVRESPTRASLGRTTVADIGGGLYRIDSFFDVFTELSLDGGANWVPDQNGPMRLTLLPEPGTAAMAGLAGLLLLRRRR